VHHLVPDGGEEIIPLIVRRGREKESLRGKVFVHGGHPETGYFSIRYELLEDNNDRNNDEDRTMRRGIDPGRARRRGLGGIG